MKGNPNPPTQEQIPRSPYLLRSKRPCPSIWSQVDPLSNAEWSQPRGCTPATFDSQIHPLLHPSCSLYLAFPAAVKLGAVFPALLQLWSSRKGCLSVAHPISTLVYDEFDCIVELNTGEFHLAFLNQVSLAILYCTVESGRPPLRE